MSLSKSIPILAKGKSFIAFQIKSFFTLFFNLFNAYATLLLRAAELAQIAYFRRPSLCRAYSLGNIIICSFRIIFIRFPKFIYSALFFNSHIEASSLAISISLNFPLLRSICSILYSVILTYYV